MKKLILSITVAFLMHSVVTVAQVNNGNKFSAVINFTDSIINLSSITYNHGVRFNGVFDTQEGEVEGKVYFNKDKTEIGRVEFSDLKGNNKTCYFISHNELIVVESNEIILVNFQKQVFQGQWSTNDNIYKVDFGKHKDYFNTIKRMYSIQ